MSHNESNLDRSLVKLHTSIQEPSYYQPWEFRYLRTSWGSGCVIDGERILTSAHVVSNARYIQAQKPGDPRKYSARVVAIGYDTETAIVTVDDRSFFDDTQPVLFGGLPKRNTDLQVYGFPDGGTDLCMTQGVVSRIEVTAYTSSMRDLLAIQTDAAVNPGGSGGPVFADGACIGLAFQGHSAEDLDKTSYIIPTPVISHFLSDLENGDIEGVPDLGLYWQKIENPSLREYLRLPENQFGVLVSDVVYGSSAWGHLKAGDVILSIDGHEVTADGSYAYRDTERLHFSHLVSQKQVGDVCDLCISRDGTRSRQQVRLRKYVALVPLPRPIDPPSYLIFGGLVFLPLTGTFLQTWDQRSIHYRFKYYNHDQFPSETRSQVVLLSQVLPHDINVGYHGVHAAVVTRVNGIEIGQMRDLRRGFSKPEGRFHVIDIEYRGPRGVSRTQDSAWGNRIVLDAVATAMANSEILEQNGIARDCSTDLMEHLTDESPA